jgi:hypothetical protein
LLDLRGTLLSAKARERVFHRTDTHWNGRGAFAAYLAIMERLATLSPALRPLPRTQFQPTAEWGPGGDLTGIIGLRDWPEERLDLVPLAPRRARMREWTPQEFQRFTTVPTGVIETSAPGAEGSLPRAVVFHDSFGVALQPLLAEHFARAVFVLGTLGFETRVVETEKPLVVIQEIAERIFMLDADVARRQGPGAAGRDR